MEKEKYRVLIVDDDFRVAMLIKKLIHWEKLDIECMDVVDNGQCALEIIESHDAPDIIITDIRMPRITGLDLISKARELHHDTSFIVISGYQEFEYARRALQYGVEDYLVKPINEEKLNATLDKIVQGLAIKTQWLKREKEIDEVVMESRHILKRDMLNSIINEKDLEREKYGVSLQGELYRGIDIKLDYIDYACRDKKQDNLVVKRVEEIIETNLEDVHEVLICEKEFLHIYCLFNYGAEKGKAIKRCISGALSSIMECVNPYKQYEVTIGIGTEQEEFGRIRFSISEAHRASGHRIKLGTGRLIYADTIAIDNASKEYLTTEEKDEIKRAIMEFSGESMESYINQIYSRFYANEETDYAICYDLAKEIIEFCFMNIDVKMDESERVRNNIYAECCHCYSIGQLKECLTKRLGQVLAESKEAIESESSKPIRKAKSYIEEHCGEKIVLEDIADIVGLNPVYFSVLFKKEMEMNFSSYLMMLRMEKAKEFLSTTNETIAAIAEMVGYKDSRHFSRIFTKYVGVKPVVYRKLYS